MSALLETRGLAVRIGDVRVCDSLDLVIHAGECWGVLGMNGVGKTTLLHTLAGLRATRAGDVFLQGAAQHALTRREVAQRVALMPQMVEDVFPATVFEEVLAGRNPHLAAWAWESAEDEEIARAALAAVGMSGFEARLTTALSGGERRRVQLATLLAQDTPLMLLDEPANHLDLHRQVRLLELIRTRVDAGERAALMSLHDVNLAARFCTHVLLIFGEGATAHGPAGAMLDEAQLERVYCHCLQVVEVDGRRIFVPA